MFRGEVKDCNLGGRWVQPFQGNAGGWASVFTTVLPQTRKIKGKDEVRVFGGAADRALGFRCFWLAVWDGMGMAVPLSNAPFSVCSALGTGQRKAFKREQG